jgi:mRNA-degrading endonuclease toxin of MazEF toxin-antitoxin module
VFPLAPPNWYPRRGEVYLVRLDKLRPVLVLSVNALNRHALDVCVVPITSVRHAEFNLRVPLGARDGGLKSPSWAKCDQVTTLEKGLLHYPALGVLSQRALRAVEEAVRIALGLSG